MDIRLTNIGKQTNVQLPASFCIRTTLGLKEEISEAPDYSPANSRVAPYSRGVAAYSFSTQEMASSRVRRIPSSCRTWTASRTVLNFGPGFQPKSDEVMAGEEGRWDKWFAGKFFAATFKKFVVVEIAVACQAINPVQLKLVLEGWTCEEALETRHAHILDVFEDHVILDHRLWLPRSPHWKIAIAA